MTSKIISKEEYIRNNAWGLLTSIDLVDCDPEILRDGEKIKEYLRQICNVIKATPFGEPVVVRFGENPDVYGYSAFQLIETSCVSGHFSEESNSIFIDIFSCKFYSQEKAIEFTKEFFKAKEVEFNIVLRGKGTC